MKRLVPVALAALLVTTSLPAHAQDRLSEEELADRLDELQQRSQQALEAYENGDQQAALDHAEAIRGVFTFDDGEASAIETTIKEISAVSIGEQVKAEASQLASAIEAGDPVEDVREIQRELEPKFNRIVLVSQGEHAPASQRELKTDEAIEEAAQAVRDRVDDAGQLYAEGEQTRAQQTAEDAFFVFESNGLGPDTTIVDEALENEVEHAIKNFQGESGDPGLADLVEQGAPQDEVQAQADEIHDGLDQVVELLKATKPPADLGDANQDGDVTIVDALLTAQAALGIDQEQTTMDANQDGAVTIVDALLISQAALGITEL